MSTESKMNTGTTIGSNGGSLVSFKPGERVRHADLGEGVVIAAPVEGFIKVFFPERRAAIARCRTDFGTKSVGDHRS